MKNLRNLEIEEKITNWVIPKPNNPELIHVTLYGNGENPPSKIRRLPYITKSFLKPSIPLMIDG